MLTTTLVVIPGPGARTVTFSSDTATVADLVSQENLHGRDIILNGRGIPASDYATTALPENAEVFATASVKGNSTTVTLVVIPGPGARNVLLTDTATVADLVSQENLHGRDIIVNGQGVPANQYSSTPLSSGVEVFATASVKGN